MTDLVSFVLFFIQITITCISIFLFYVFCIFLYSLFKIYKKRKIKFSSDEIQFMKDEYFKDPEATMRVISKLSQAEQEILLNAIKEDNDNWINLSVDKVGDMLYFYDTKEDSNKFLFQCKTYQEMIDILQNIKGNKGVRISHTLLQKPELKEFFSVMEIGKNVNESV